MSDNDAANTVKVTKRKNNKKQENPLDAASFDVASSGLLEKIEQEIRNGYRIFTFNEKEYRIFLPSIKVDEKLSAEKSRIVARLLRDESLITKDEAILLMKKRGTWTDELQKQENLLRKRLGECIADIFLHRSVSTPNKEELEELTKERISIEMELRLLTANKDFFLNSTIESRIEEELLKLKLTLCIKDSENNYLFNTVEELENYPDKGFINAISTEAIYFWAGIDQSIFGYALD